MVGPVSGGLVFRGRNTLLGVAVAEAAPFHYQVVDGEVSSRTSFLRRGEVFSLAGARLTLQQLDSDVGHPELLLALQPKRIQGLPPGEGSVNHLQVIERDEFLYRFNVFRGEWSVLQSELTLNINWLCSRFILKYFF